MKVQGLVLVFLVLFSCKSKEQKDSQPPNILIMLADDMGYVDLGIYGGESLTPNLDSLAENGIRFTDFYAAAPNCSPSRAGLLTGRAPARVGMYNYRSDHHNMHLRAEEITIAELLKEQGYQTAHIGKWHLGELPDDTIYNHPQPHEQGFDYSLGTENNAQPSHLNPVNFVRNGKKLPEQKGYSCQILADEVETWFNEHYNPDQPFFLYVAFHEPHQKVASPPELIAHYPQYQGFAAEYLANVENLDLAAGRILSQLDQKELTENTLVLFSSDNGSYRQASNDPLRARKAFLYEGGIRVPGIFSWPGQLEQGNVINDPAGFVDILPTIADIVGISLPTDRTFDGTSILPILKNQPFARNAPLFWFFYRSTPEIAIRMGDLSVLGKDQDTVPRTHPFTAPDMKYIQNMELQQFEIYDLSVDLSQKNNLLNEIDTAQVLIDRIRAQLDEIQQEGYQWDSLPPAKGRLIPKMQYIQ